MPDDKQARREKADRLRKQVEQLKSASKEKKDTPEMKPGESPNEYVERRMREISHKKPSKK